MNKVFSKGILPYELLTNREVNIQIPNGLRLAQPESCPKDIWDVIFLCFKDPKARPSFSSLLNSLWKFRVEALQKGEGTKSTEKIYVDNQYYEGAAS